MLPSQEMFSPAAEQDLDAHINSDQRRDIDGSVYFVLIAQPAAIKNAAGHADCCKNNGLPGYIAEEIQ